MQSPDPTPHPHPFTAGFTKRQHQQLQRLVRADRWLHARTRRSISRGDAHWKTFRRLRKGLIELLRAALLQLGDQGAGGYRWRQLLARAQALLPANAACNAALNLFSEMPYRTVESTQHGSREELLAHLAIVQRYQSAAWDVQFVAGMVAGGAIGLVEGCWLRLSPYSSPCFVLRYNGISALLGYAQDQSVQDHVDLLAALAKGQLQRIDDPSEIESLNQRLFTPLGSAFWRDEDGDEDEDGLTQSAPTIDPDYAHLPLIQTCDIAGLYYHQAKAVAAHIAAGMVVCLRRDPDNAFDADAIDVRMPADLPAGEKLGYIPRLCNQPLARRMDKGVALLARISLVRWREGVQQGRPARIEIEIRSTELNDTADPDAADAGLAPWQRYLKANKPPAYIARSQRPAHAAMESLEKAQSHIATSDISQFWHHVTTASTYFKEAWLFLKGHLPDARWGFYPWPNPQQLPGVFEQFTKNTAMGMQLFVLEQSLLLLCRLEASLARNTALALDVLRLEIFWRNALAPTYEHAYVIQINPPPRPPVDVLAPPTAARALLYGQKERFESLRLLRRLFIVARRVECGLPSSTSSLRCLRHFTRDRTLVQSLIRRLMRMVQEDLRRVFKPAPDGTCWETQPEYVERYPAMYQNEIPHTVRWSLITQATALLESEQPDLETITALRLQLRLLQPWQIRPRGKRRTEVRCYEIFMADLLLACAQTLDLAPLLENYCVAVPALRRNRLLAWKVWELFDALCLELFAMQRQDMLQTYPALLCADAADLDFAITAWERTAHQAANAPAQHQAAKTLLQEALITHPRPLPEDLGARIVEFAAL